MDRIPVLLPGTLVQIQYTTVHEFNSNRNDLLCELCSGNIPVLVTTVIRTSEYLRKALSGGSPTSETELKKLHLGGIIRRKRVWRKLKQ